MASIEKRGNSYRIKVSCGYKADGTQVFQRMTWTPDEKMTAKQIEKEVQRQAILFEEECKRGQIVSAVKFEAFAEEWFEEYAKLNLKSTTYTRQRQLTKRVYAAIGHLRIDKISARQLQGFVNSLAKDGANKKTGKPLAAKTIRHNLSFISDVFSYAVKMGVISENPCTSQNVQLHLGSRYLHASLLINAGVDVVAVSGDLGHAQVSTTSNIYCHMIENSQARASEAIANALNFGSGA